MSRRSELLAIAMTLLVSACGDPAPPVERARSLLEHDGEFGTALESGDSFAHVAELLLDAGDAYRPAAAWAQVVAVEVLHCTQPGVHDARAALADHLDAVAASPSGPAVELPSLPSC
jgi:hypothetical protein